MMQYLVMFFFLTGMLNFTICLEIDADKKKHITSMGINAVVNKEINGNFHLTNWWIIYVTGDFLRHGNHF